MVDTGIVLNLRRQIHAWFVVFLAALASAVGGVSSAQAATHVVRDGETVATIAAAHGTTAVAIVRANALANADLLQIRQRLNVPSPTPSHTIADAPAAGTLTVRAGDTLGAIAMRTGTTARAIADANGIVDPNAVRVGIRLRIPSGHAPASAEQGGATTTLRTLHVVRAGDTLTALAARSGTTAIHIASANRMHTTDVLAIGRRLIIPRVATVRAQTGTSPATGRYIVRAGDTIGAIAARHGVSADALSAANGLRDADVIAIGQRLRLPGRVRSMTPVTPPPSTPVTAATRGWGGQPDRTRIRTLIAQSAGRYGVDPALVRAIAWQESGWWQGARSSAGAIGVMQLMPETAAWVGPALVGRRIDATDARDNIDGGTAYVAWLLRHADDRNRAVAAYYQGLGSVQSRGMFADTRQYVRSVNSHYGVR